MRDLIDRKMAITALGERPTVYAGSAYGLGCRNQFDTDRLAIDTVPSAEITLKDVQEWCYKRGLTIIDSALYLEMRSRY